MVAIRSGACRAARRTPPDRRRRRPGLLLRRVVVVLRSVPRRWRGKSPPAAARPAADTAAARSVGLARAIIARPPRWCRPWSPSARTPMAAELVADAVGLLEVLGLGAAAIAARAMPRLSISSAREAPARAACSARHAFSSSRRKPKNPSVPASALRPAAFFKPCISAIAFGVLMSSSNASSTCGAGRGSASVDAASKKLASAFSASSSPFTVQLIGCR